MPEILFSEQTADSQHGEFTFSDLGPGEHQLVETIINWDNPGKFSELAYMVHGRSITFVSPDRLGLDPMEAFQGRFRGLQLIGAGGSISALRQGVHDIPKQILVSPVNPANHAEQLSEILQQRTIDEHGNLQFWQRPYSPLHGMDKKEANRREAFTGQLDEFLGSLSEDRSCMPFVVPEYAAGGYFPGMVDEEGIPLQFQVYRVPLVPRLPSQIIRTIQSHGYDDTLVWLADAAATTGSTFRILHAMDLAHMDGHLGNMSFLNDGDEKRTLFITDLGSMEDITNHPFNLRYHGFDVYMFLESMRGLTEDLAHWVERNKFSEKDWEDVEEDLMLTVGYNMLRGYLMLNRLETGKPEELREELDTKIREQGMQLLRGFAQSVDYPQQFLEFFEQYSAELS